MGGSLVLVRHGESVWDREGRLSGWSDVGLTRAGVEQSARAGGVLRSAGLLPDVVYTSVLSRSVMSANVMVESAGRLWAPQVRTWQLNEAHAGAFTGAHVSDLAADAGVVDDEGWGPDDGWCPPPSLPGAFDDPRYGGVDVPLSESVADVERRVFHVWSSAISLDVAAGAVVWVVAHDAPVRVLASFLEASSEVSTRSFTVEPAVARAYRFGPRLKVESAVVVDAAGVAALAD